MKVGFLHSLIRPEEKFLINEIRSRDEVNLILLDDRNMEFNLETAEFDLDLLLNRSINHSRSLNAIKLFESFGIKCINSSYTVGICGDKLLTSVALREHGIPQPNVSIAFSEEAALNAMEKMGFPVVLKPAVGSWGRLLSKINDRDTAYSILEHKKILGTYHHTIYYIQKYVEKKRCDIRTIVVGNECIAATYRTSDHWITNAARGSRSIVCPLTDEIKEISLQAANAVGGDIVGVDLFETPEGYLVNEINHTLEFKSCFSATGLNIPKLIADFVIKMANGYTMEVNAKCVDRCS